MPVGEFLSIIIIELYTSAMGEFLAGRALVIVTECTVSLGIACPFGIPTAELNECYAIHVQLQT